MIQLDQFLNLDQNGSAIIYLKGGRFEATLLIDFYQRASETKPTWPFILGEMIGAPIWNVTWIFVITFAHFVLLDSRRKVDLENI